MSRPAKVIPELCEGFDLGINRKTYTKRDICLYALGVGVSSDPMDLEDLRFTYENADGFTPLPSYSVVIPPLELVFEGLNSCPGMPEINPMMLLHGEEKLVIHKPLEVEGTVECVNKISQVIDKGKGALVILTTSVYEIPDPPSSRAVRGALLCSIDVSLFIRGIGGFSDGSSKKEMKMNSSNPTTSLVIKPNRQPDVSIIKHTTPNQAILYRLSGDLNPLHIDPDLAALGGFDRPILHGLCSFGIVTHCIVKYLLKNDGEGLASIEGRFASPVTPGDDLQVDIWLGDDNKNNKKEVFFRVVNLTSKKECLSAGRASLKVDGSVNSSYSNNKGVMRSAL